MSRPCKRRRQPGQGRPRLCACRVRLTFFYGHVYDVGDEDDDDDDNNDDDVLMMIDGEVDDDDNDDDML